MGCIIRHCTHKITPLHSDMMIRNMKVTWKFQVVTHNLSTHQTWHKHNTNNSQTHPSSLNPLQLSLGPKHAFYAKHQILIQYFSNQT